MLVGSGNPLQVGPLPIVFQGGWGYSVQNRQQYDDSVSNRGLYAVRCHCFQLRQPKLPQRCDLVSVFLQQSVCQCDVNIAELVDVSHQFGPAR